MMSDVKEPASLWETGSVFTRQVREGINLLRNRPWSPVANATRVDMDEKIVPLGVVSNTTGTK